MRIWLSGVRNPTHLVYAASWLRTQAPCQLSVIDAGGFIAAGLVTRDDISHWLGDIPGIEIDYPATVTGQLPRTYLAIGTPGIKPWLALRRTKPFGRLPVVVVDEGLGSYGSIRTQQAALNRQRGRSWRTGLTTVARSAARLLTTTNWSLYLKTATGWELNQLVAAEFRRVEPSPTRSVIYLSQPWPQLGICPQELYLDHLREVADTVQAAEYELLIKPHPMEQAAEFTAAGLTVHESRLPAELDPTVLGAPAVLGTQSTALLNLAAVHRRPAWRVRFGALDQLEADLGRDQASLLAAFLPPPIELTGLAAQLG